jgi:alpha-mannosidase
VPQGTVRMETPWAVVRPNEDQLAGSCRNWFTVQRWVDVSDDRCGIAWAPLDAPLMELGGLTANLLGSVAFNEWMTNALDSQTIYSWAQNNHWHTNYKVDQPGVTTFRYVLRPRRGGYSPIQSARFGLEPTRPLLAASAAAGAPPTGSLLTLSSPDVLLETIKVSDDGNAIIARLFGVTGKPESVRLRWNSVKPVSTWLTDLSEKPLSRLGGSIAVPAYGVVFVRAELGGS